MRYAWTLLLAGFLSLSLALSGAALAAPNGFTEHKLPGLTIDLPSDWQIAPKEALAQLQKKAGDMKILLAAQSPEVPQFAIMEQPIAGMEQVAFVKLDDAGVQEICAQAISGFKQGGATEVNCSRQTTAKGAAMAITALFPARGLCNVSWGFYKGKKTLAVSAMLRQRDTKLPAKLETALKSIRLGK